MLWCDMVNANYYDLYIISISIPFLCKLGEMKIYNKTQCKTWMIIVFFIVLFPLDGIVSYVIVGLIHKLCSHPPQMLSSLFLNTTLHNKIYFVFQSNIHSSFIYNALHKTAIVHELMTLLISLIRQHNSFIMHDYYTWVISQIKQL